MAVSTDAEPLLGVLPSAMEKTEPSVRPSMSVAVRVPVMAVSSAPEPVVSPVIDARSSTALMVSAMACVVVPSQSSVTVMVNRSVPLKLAVGV